MNERKKQKKKNERNANIIYSPSIFLFQFVKFYMSLSLNRIHFYSYNSLPFICFKSLSIVFVRLIIIIWNVISLSLSFSFIVTHSRTRLLVLFLITLSFIIFLFFSFLFPFLFLSVCSHYPFVLTLSFSLSSAFFLFFFFLSGNLTEYRVKDKSFPKTFQPQKMEQIAQPLWEWQNTNIFALYIFGFICLSF